MSGCGVQVIGSNFGDGSLTSVQLSGVPVVVDWSQSSQSALLFYTSLCQGVVTVTVADRVSNNKTYSYEELVAEPSVSSLTPSSGPTNGGTVVTILGLAFQLEGRVEFVYAGTGSSGVVVIGECVWRGIDGMSYDIATIRCVAPPGQVRCRML